MLLFLFQNKPLKCEVAKTASQFWLNRSGKSSLENISRINGNQCIANNYTPNIFENHSQIQIYIV